MPVCVVCHVPEALVSSAVHNKAGVTGHTPHVFATFASPILQMFLVPRRLAATMHEVKPNHEAQLIARVVERIALVRSPTPHTHDVLGSVDCGLQEPSHLCISHSILKVVSWNPVAAFGVH